MNVFLLVAESVLYLVFSVLLFRKERMYGIIFFLLYIYAIFSQIGYLYLPELSMSLFAYFGEGIWRPVTLFIICSGIALFAFLRFASDGVQRFFQTRVMARFPVSPAADGSLWQRTAVLLFAGTLFVETVIFALNFSFINWANVQQEGLFSAAFGVGVFILLVKLSVGSNLALYCVLRQFPAARRSHLLIVLFTVSLLLFLVFTYKLGNRTDDVAFLLGVAVFETSQIRLRPRHFVLSLALAGMVVVYLNFLEDHRYQEGAIETDLAAKILVKDYYSPAHILFAAVNNEMVSPLGVITSNCGNALMFLGQPYLQAPVMATFYPGGATRSASYAFYPFTEGYLFAGFAGFLYNGVVLGTLIVFWRSVATTNSPRFNQYLLAILGSMLVNLVRGQSSYYVKYLYTFILPNAALYLCLCKQQVRWDGGRRGVGLGEGLPATIDPSTDL